MNKYLLFGIIIAFGITSLVGLAAVNSPVLAQDNMTMNTSSETPVENTSEISDTGAGLDANMMMGDNMTGMNMTEHNMTGMQ
jgi:hypothetical protein